MVARTGLATGSASAAGSWPRAYVIDALDAVASNQSQGGLTAGRAGWRTGPEWLQCDWLGGGRWATAGI
eukprot:1194397-Prorocentrum_minimum.AAC.10